ncbi:hypothetical protein LG274_02765 [Micrococcus antarcticus]|uniref:hypothetical protein n=1 Tax=Micrococcus antarcticus TaxID=86171 RepID=UPI0038511622
MTTARSFTCTGGAVEGRARLDADGTGALALGLGGRQVVGLSWTQDGRFVVVDANHPDIAPLTLRAVDDGTGRFEFRASRETGWPLTWTEV